MRRAMQLAGVLALTMAGGAAWAETYALDFTGRTADASQMFMTGEADGVIALRNVWEPVAAPGTPLDGATGDCFGNTRMTAGMFTGDGYCAYTDTAGETVFIRWSMDNTPVPSGSWHFAGGTGMWAHAQGGGTFADTPTDEAGVSMSHILGTLQIN